MAEARGKGLRLQQAQQKHMLMLRYCPMGQVMESPFLNQGLVCSSSEIIQTLGTRSVVIIHYQATSQSLPQT